jgi:hypothetical protein
MKRNGLAVAVVCGLGAAASTEAQVSRVFVSVLGNDANVCSDVATPCRTIAGGVTQVDPDGEVIIIASGSYAGGTISKAVKINAAAGVVAFSGLPITVNPGAGNRVVIRGMTIKAAPGGGIGITLSSGRLSVEATVIDGWGYGILVSESAEALTVDGSAFRNNAIALDGGLASPGVAHITVQNSQATDDEYAFSIRPGYTAVLSNVDITGPGLTGIANQGVAVVANCRISNRSTGIINAGGTIRVSGSVVTKNTAGVSNGSGSLVSFGNNLISGNAVVDTSGAITPGILQ